MRWVLLSTAAAVALIMLGFVVVGPDNLNIAEKTIYWLCVVAFLMAQGSIFSPGFANTTFDLRHSPDCCVGNFEVR